MNLRSQIQATSRLKKKDYWLHPHIMDYYTNHYLFHHKGPGWLVKNGPWDEEEEEPFIKLIENSISNNIAHLERGFFSLRMPFRTGKQCYNKYIEIHQKGVVPELPEVTEHEKMITLNAAFTKQQEDMLEQIIRSKIEEGEGLTVEQTKNIIMDFYNSPTVMATRVSQILACKHGIDIYDENGNKTDKFLNLFNSTLELAETEPQIVLNMGDLQCSSVLIATCTIF